MASAAHLRIGIVGGTGPHGKGLALRFACAGHDIVVGSRDAGRAEQTAVAIRERIVQLGRSERSGNVTSGTNGDAAQAEVVVIAVPFEGLDALLEDLDVSGRLVVSCVNPLAFGPGGVDVLAVSEGSAAQRIAARCPDARVTAAFHHVSAVTLWDDDELHPEHVLVVGDDADARATTVALAAAVTALGGVDAGALRHAGILESMTAVLIGINRRYRARSGVIIAGLPDLSPIAEAPDS